MVTLIRPRAMPENPTAHTLFVHGLDGDSYRTWLSGARIKEFWPDWLSEDIPNLAVWSIGYEATSIWWKQGAALALPDRAASILPRLANETALQVGDIYFVTHSLGGLVVESVLRLAEARAPHSREVANFLRRVRKIVFIGTPHSGSDQASLTNKLRAILRPRATTAGLSRNDPHLRELNTWFRSFAAANGLDSIVLRETLRVPLFGIPGLGGIVVKADSADPGLSPATEVIPIVADHHGIVAPENRDADVYQHLQAFISRTPSGKHHDTLIADRLAGLGGVVGARADHLSAELKATRGEILAALEKGYPTNFDESSIVAASIGQENAIVTNELDQRLWLLRRSRYVLGFNLSTETRRILSSLERGGELHAASAAAKRLAFAWGARLLASVDIDAAELALADAEAIAHGEENIIASAFITAFRAEDPNPGLARLSGLRTPQSNTAAFLIAAINKGPAEALKWLSDSGLTITDLDSDGRFGVLHRRIAAGDIDQALLDALVLTEADFECTPALLNVVATAHLAAAIHPDLRMGVLEHLPIGLDDFPLNGTPDAIEHRRQAGFFYARAQVAFNDLKQERAANMSADYELWLALRDDSNHLEARRKLELSMSDPKHRLRRLPIAFLFGLKLDNNAIELELEREATRTGGGSPELAIARFAMARAQSNQSEVASYIDRHRNQLTEYFNPTWIQCIEAEALARSMQLDQARAVFRELETKDEVPASAIESLRRLIDEKTGSDPIEIAEKQYVESKHFPDLLNLFSILKDQNAWAKLATYGKELFEQTQTPSHGTTYAEALYRTGRYMELLDVAGNFPALAALSPFKHIQAWALFRLGDLMGAKRLLEENRQGWDSESARTIESNIAIASGDWSALNVFVEDQWVRRDRLSAEELLRAGGLAQHIGSTRDRDLITEAATKAEGNATILAACYNAAVTAGWEDKEEIQNWLNTAVKNSNDDGPIKRYEFHQIVDMAPDWAKRESDTWGQLLTGNLPMYAGALLTNRSPVEMFLMTGLANLDEIDTRKRGIILAYSGTRPLVEVTASSVAFDTSALLSLAFMGQLESAFELFEKIRLPHRTMGWLLEQRYKSRFHQPSQIKDAEELRRLVDAGLLSQFERTQPANVHLETEVGEDLAAMLVEASVADPNQLLHRFVVRPFPVHKPESLMEELSDLSAYESVIVDCTSLVAALKRLGHLTEAEENRAQAYLSAQHDSWKRAIEPIPSGAELFLDDLAVSYLQHLGLLGKLRAAGFKAYISTHRLAFSDALLDRRKYSDAVHTIIEEIREKVLEGVRAGRIQFGMEVADHDGDHTSDPAEHPTRGLFEVTDAEAFVIDDRFFNQHGLIDLSTGSRLVHTSLDLLEALRGKGRISDATFGEILTRLRRAGFLLIPILPTELEAAIVGAPVVDGVLQETAELKAIREAHLKVRMGDVLQLPKESQWMDGNLRTILHTLRRQWRSDVADEVSRARSNWLAPFLDLRGWAHRYGSDQLQTEERRAAQILLLSQIPNTKDSVQSRYEAWFEEEILNPVKEYEKNTYKKVLATARSVVEATADYRMNGLEDDEVGE